MPGKENEGKVSIHLDQIVPWGRSLGEYIRMFDLTDRNMQSSILDCAGGPASFNAEVHRRNRNVISCDPIYVFSTRDIAAKVDEACQTVLRAAEQNRANFVWREIESAGHLRKLRMETMRQFLEDFPIGASQGRYLVAALPKLPFRAKRFDLALCSHFLFTYSNMLTLQFHLDSIRELCRVGAEARIFPLLPGFGNERSSYVLEVMNRLTAEGYGCEVRSVAYEFQKGGNEMLRVWQS